MKITINVANDVEIKDFADFMESLIKVTESKNHSFLVTDVKVSE